MKANKVCDLRKVNVRNLCESHVVPSVPTNCSLISLTACPPQQLRSKAAAAWKELLQSILGVVGYVGFSVSGQQFKKKSAPSATDVTEGSKMDDMFVSEEKASAQTSVTPPSPTNSFLLPHLSRPSCAAAPPGITLVMKMLGSSPM